MVLFPFATVSLSVERDGLTLVNDAMTADRLMVVVHQKNVGTEKPNLGDLSAVGTLSVIVRMVRHGDESAHVLVRGLARARLLSLEVGKPYLLAKVSLLEDQDSGGVELEGLGKAVLDQFTQLVNLSDEMPSELAIFVRNVQPLGALADVVAALTELSVPERQRLLEELSVKDRLSALAGQLGRQLQVAEVGQKIQAQVRGSMNQQQKEFLLRQQLEAIQKELGEKGDVGRELEELKQKLDQAELPPAVRKEADRELRRLATIPTQSPEHSVARTYLDWLADMPWAVSTEDNLDLSHARAILDQDHTDLDKIKERILEYLAVRHFKPDARTPIVCFVGPPGTGKTSLGRSIARALGRKFVRQSLGGVRDEAEIRGHRRTYIGAMPGNIIQGIRRAGSNNPLFMLDEVDKLGIDFRGDPASALLEVLDPEQNSSFVDHYLDAPFDLSKTLFICTANILDPVPPALRDRMEVITLSGYTEQEKLAIARQHLIPKSVRESGLESLGIEITDGAVTKIVREYTGEAGLRNLERELQALLRRTAKLVAEGKEATRTIDEARVRALLGPERFNLGRIQALNEPGAALALAWTPSGGEVLVIEATAMPGRQELLLTGKLGEVMKESALAALSYVRSHASALRIDPKRFEKTDVHVHIPAGAIAKDGPSAGVALCAAVVSLFTGRLPVPKTAMTGEITLLGRVLPVGGVKEKVLAAHRADLTRVLLPLENQKDLEEVPPEVRDALTFLPVERLEQALELALSPSAEKPRQVPDVSADRNADVGSATGSQSEKAAAGLHRVRRS
jgi:ATP-dependent Lon protease